MMMVYQGHELPSSWYHHHHDHHHDDHDDDHDDDDGTMMVEKTGRRSAGKVPARFQKPGFRDTASVPVGRFEPRKKCRCPGLGPQASPHLVSPAWESFYQGYFTNLVFETQLRFPTADLSPVKSAGVLGSAPRRLPTLFLQPGSPFTSIF